MKGVLDFFKKKVVKIISWVVLFGDIAVLAIGGATEKEFTTGIALALSVVAAVSAIIAFITERTE